MRRTQLLLLALSALVAPTDLRSQWTEVPDGGSPVLQGDAPGALRLVGTSLASINLVPAEGIPSGRAHRIEVRGPLRNQWDVQLMGTTAGDLRAGDTVFVSFFMRGGAASNETGEAAATAYLQRSTAPFEKLLTFPVTAGPQWQQYLFATRLPMGLPSGQHNFTLFLGFVPQWVEIAGLTIVNYGAAVSPGDLPKSKIRWAGMEPDAAWRAKADEAIDRIRKGALKVIVQDAAGKPVPGAQVHVLQKRHAFGFGSAVAADALLTQGPDGDRYREVVRTWFNKAVPENDLKWPGWEANPTRAMNGLRWLRENGIQMVRGHTLVWPGWQYMPRDVQTLAGNPDALRRRVRNHITDEATAVRGWVTEWDVLNEPCTNTALQQILGDEEMAEWFRLTRNADPDALLYINDYSILSAGGFDRAHQDCYFNIVTKLNEWGAPVDGIGMQGHFGRVLTAPEKIWEILDRFATLGKRIQITEFDVDVDDEEARAAYTKDFLAAIFSHPSVDGFMMWGFWEGRHWKPSTAMFRRDWTLKPNAEAFQEMVFGRWWTDARGETGETGQFSLRVFKGEHEIEVSYGGRTVLIPQTVLADAVEVLITLPEKP